jgi:hypothetical protein
MWVVYLIYSFETGSFYVAQVGLKLVILLPQPPRPSNQCLDYRSALPCFALFK